MSGPTYDKAYSQKHYDQWLDQAVEALLLGTLRTKKEAVQLASTTNGGQGGIQFAATVSTFDNTQLDTPAKVKLAQDVDVAGDRAKVMTIWGLDEAGVFVTEDLALAAGNSNTPVESVEVYSKIFAVHPASTLGNQDVKVYETSNAANLICTVPKSSALGIESTLAIPAPSGTVAVPKSYKTDNGLFLSVTHVFNITDDATKTTNLLAAGAFDTNELHYGVVDGFAKVPQKIFLNTGAGAEKTYEVCGTYLPYQGVLAASSAVAVEVLAKGDDIFISSCGTNVASELATSVVDRDYAPISPKLPLTASYADVTMVYGTIDIAGLTEYADSLAFRTEKPKYMAAAGARLTVGKTLTFNTTAAARGVIAASIGSEAVLVGGDALGGSTPCGKYFFLLGKVTNKGANAHLEDQETVLVCIGTTSSEAPVQCSNAVDIFKLES